MTGRASGARVPDARERVWTNPQEADLDIRRLARRVHAMDGVHTCAGLAMERKPQEVVSFHKP
jgi:hypothetical protein